MAAGGALEAAFAQLGPFGFYQRYVLFMLCIPNIFSAMYSLNYVFVADSVPFRCAVPECEQYPLEYDNPAASALLPADTSCSRYAPREDLDNTTCNPLDFLQDTVECDRFVYENLDTIFGAFNLGCREWMRTLVGSIRNAALPIALLLTGYLSDSYGRRTAFCIFAACAGVLGVTKSFSVNYQMYVSLEFFEAALGYGFNSAGYVMLLELAKPSLRAHFGCATGMAYGLGGVIFAFLAAAIPYWRSLLFTMYAPALLLTTYWLILDESPRWLHSKGRSKDAAEVIKKAAKWNKKTIDEHLLQELETEEAKAEEDNNKGNPWLRLLKSKVLVIRFALCGWCWIASTFVYYGLTINSVSLSGDKYKNFALNMAMEIVASLLLMMTLDRFGRKKCIFVAFLICGVACVTPFILDHGQTKIAMFFVGKLSITFAFNSVYVFTAELFPTDVRCSALAACSLIGRIGSIVAPQTPLLSVNWQAALYGGCSLVASVMVLLAPETRWTELPKNVQDAEVVDKTRGESK